MVVFGIKVGKRKKTKQKTDCFGMSEVKKNWAKKFTLKIIIRKKIFV